MNQLWQFVLEIFNTPIGEMTTWKLILAVMLSILVIWLSLKVLKYAWIVIKIVFKTIKNIFSAKRRCSKIQCKCCGRTLDKCICQRNKNRTYLSRLYHYKKENK